MLPQPYLDPAGEALPDRSLGIVSVPLRSTEGARFVGLTRCRLCHSLPHIRPQAPPSTAETTFPTRLRPLLLLQAAAEARPGMDEIEEAETFAPLTRSMGRRPHPCRRAHGPQTSFSAWPLLQNKNRRFLAQRAPQPQLFTAIPRSSLYLDGLCVTQSSPLYFSPPATASSAPLSP